MKTVNIAELKNNLSSYLKNVQRGEEIIVKDRNVPIAKIVPLAVGDDDQLSALASAGLIRLGQGKVDDSVWSMAAPRLRAQALREALDAERVDD